MTDDMDKKADLDEIEVDEDEAERQKVLATAEAKQLRHRLDEYVAMAIGIGAVLILWLLQYLGLY
jgi:hypothetical protein